MADMTDKMSQASAGQSQTQDVGIGTPKKGDCFRCQKCGMEVQVTVSCTCKGSDHAHFHCCGEEMQKV